MWIQLLDRKISYKITGRGPTPVVLLHGGPGFPLETIAAIHELLPPDNFTVISYNQSGSPGNEGAVFYKTINEYAAELKEILRQLNINKPFLLGHSFGCAVVLEYAVQNPGAHVQGLILVNGFASGQRLAAAIRKRVEELPTKFYDRRSALLRSGDMNGIDALLGEYWLPRHICRCSPLPQDILTGLVALRDSAVYYYYIGHDGTNPSGALLLWDRTDDLGTIKLPVLVMSGEYDYGGRGDFDELCRRMPRATGWFDPEVSHFPMYEQPEGFRKALLEFLERYGKL